ncbi:MAG: histidinol-phosphatase [Bacteroidota bacterium]
MNYFNFHTHTIYCDGKAQPEDYVKEAVKRKMSALGFSCHSPLPFDNGYSIKEHNIEKYVSEIRALKEKYNKQINIFLGFEFDYVPGLSDDVYLLKQRMATDYVIGSVHLVRNRENGRLWFIDGPEKNYLTGLQDTFNNDIKLAVQAYYYQISEMVLTQNPDIIGHIDKIKMHNKNRFFSEDEDWYKDLINQLLDIVQKNGCVVEVNTRGIYRKRCDSLYPGVNILKKIYKRNIPVTISSDAHLPVELILYYDETIGILKDIGFNSIKYFSGKIWQDIPL